MRVSSIILVSILLSAAMCESPLTAAIVSAKRNDLHTEFVARMLKYFLNLNMLIPSVNYHPFIRIVKKVALADNLISEAEKNAAVGLWKMTDSDDQQINIFFTTNSESIDLEKDLSTLVGESDVMRKYLLYFSVAVASADGFDDAERALVNDMIRILNIDSEDAEVIIRTTIADNISREERFEHIGILHW